MCIISTCSLNQIYSSRRCCTVLSNYMIIVIGTHTRYFGGGEQSFTAPDPRKYTICSKMRSSALILPYVYVSTEPWCIHGGCTMVGRKFISRSLSLSYRISYVYEPTIHTYFAYYYPGQLLKHMLLHAILHS